MKTINKVFLILLVILASTPLFAQRVINVSTVAQLYAAVNKAANAGAEIHLAPGTYVLSATNAQGGRRPNHGRLLLQPGMSLVGSEQRVDSNFDGIPDPVSPATPDDFAVPGTETKIDGSELILQPSDFIGPDCAREVFAISEPPLPVGSVNVSARIRSTVLEGFPFAMAFGNNGCNARHSRSVLIFTNNVVRNTLSFGLLLVNLLTGSKSRKAGYQFGGWKALACKIALRHLWGAFRFSKSTLASFSLCGSIHS